MAQRWISPIRSKRLAAVARDGGAKGRFADVRADMMTRAVAESDADHIVEKRIESGQGSIRIVWYVFRLGPRHGRTCFDDQNRVRGSVREITFIFGEF